jgi:DNA-binding response OmpR family regulator
MDCILIVDDDPETLDTVGFLLDEAGYRAVTALNKDGMFRELEKESPDLVILDVMLGSENGFELAMQMRKTSSIPIIMLTGRRTESDRVVGLELGADDYITKPYGSAELLARVKSVLRRSKMPRTDGPAAQREVAVFDGWKCDLTGRKLFSPSGDEVILTSGEFSLLAAFVRNPERVLSRESLLDHISRKAAFDRSIDVQVMRLRRRIEADPGSPQLIQAVRGVGYVFSAKVNWSQS